MKTKKISRLYFMFKHTGIDIDILIVRLVALKYIKLVDTDRFIELRKLKINEVTKELENEF